MRPKTKMHRFTTMQVRSFAQAQSPIFSTPNPCCFMHRFFCRRCAWHQLGHLADDDRHGAHHQSVMVWCRRHIVLSSTRVARMYDRCKSWIERLCGAKLVFLVCGRRCHSGPWPTLASTSLAPFAFVLLARQRLLVFIFMLADMRWHRAACVALVDGFLIVFSRSTAS